MVVVFREISNVDACTYPSLLMRVRGHISVSLQLSQYLLACDMHVQTLSMAKNRGTHRLKPRVMIDQLSYEPPMQGLCTCLSRHHEEDCD
jgi:hypothetical protein